MKIISKIIDAAEERVNKYGAQYFTFAIFGLINYPLAFFYEYVVNNDSTSLWLRCISTLLCFILLFKDKIPIQYHRYIPFYWYFTLTISLATAGTLFLLQNQFSLAYLINFNIGVMVVILLVDWLSFLMIEVIGIIFALIINYFTHHHLPPLPNDDYINLFFYMFFCIVVLGSIFTRNKEIYNDQLQKIKDNINTELENKISERTYELQHALAAKTEFLNNMSHEIRTPISGFTTISEILVESWDKFDEEKRYSLARQVYLNCKRLYSLIGNLLDLSKFNAGKMLLDLQIVDLNLLVSNMIDECRTLYLSNKKISFEFIPAIDGKITADSERIIQVLRNIVTNAIKYSNCGSIISIKILNKESAYKSGKFAKSIHVSISDQGIGIPDSELTIIFDPFIQSTRTKTQAGGTGLGLAICKEIIEAHRGKIWAENNIDKGSTFHFIIPLIEKKHHTENNVEEKQSLNSSSSDNKISEATILVIDDEEICLTSIELILANTNYRVIKALGGREGLEYLNNNKGSSVDLILLDLMMPDIYGLNLLKIFKQTPNFAEIPVILQSGTSDMAEIDKAYKLGIVTYIKKPYNQSIVVNEIYKVLSSRVNS